MTLTRSKIQGLIFLLSLLGALGGVLVIGARRAAAGERDYSPWHEGWNGLSKLVAMARQTGAVVRVENDVTLDALATTTALFFIYPTATLPSDDLRRFLSSGGTVVLADDFGSADDFLAELGVQKLEISSLSSVQTYAGDGRLAIAESHRPTHPLAFEVDQIVTNHPAYFRSDFTPVFKFSNPEYGAVLSLTVGPGRLVLLSDPSIFINLMLQFPDNRQFTRNLLSLTVGQQTAELWIVAKHFRTHGTFVPPKGSATTQGEQDTRKQLLETIQAVLELWNEYRIDRPVIPVTTWLLWAFFLIIVVLLLPLKRIFYDGSWVTAGDPPPMGEYHARMARHLHSKTKNYLEPACLLRDHLDAELEWRLRVAAPLTLLKGRRADKLLRTHYDEEVARLFKQAQSLVKFLPPTDRLKNGALRKRVTWGRLLRLERIARQLLDKMGNQRIPSPL
jgi:hypothetical protein